MAKEINLGQSSKEELLARVTSKPGTKPKAPPPPQPKGFTMPPGVTGTVPLPSGKVVGAVMPSGLSAAERDALEGIGWTPDIPIPTNMAEILESERLRRAAESDEVVLPIDPRTPPLKIEEKKLSEVTPEERAHVLEVMKTAFEAQQQQIAEQQQQERLKASAAQIPGLEQAVRLASQPTSKSAAPADQHNLIEDDSKQQSTPDSKSTFESPTGANAGPAFCPHCQWDLSRVDVPEATYSEKMVWLHALLGQKSYIKDYELFGGNVIATFRTLTAMEIDAVYKQAWRDQETGKIITQVDYWERINRYRLFLQLQTLKGTGPASFMHDLPDGLSKETNPDCTATWNVAETIVSAGDTALPAIEDWVIKNVLKTEAVFRVVNTACNQFNRLVAHLEAMADNSDFWRPTEEQF